MCRRAFPLALAGLASASLLAGCGAVRAHDPNLPFTAATGEDTPADTPPAGPYYYLDLVDGVADPLLQPSTEEIAPMR